MMARYQCSHCGYQITTADETAKTWHHTPCSDAGYPNEFVKVAWPVHPCDEDHMHTWKLAELGDYGWYCVGAIPDATTPAQEYPDAQESLITGYTNYEWVSYKPKSFSFQDLLDEHAKSVAKAIEDEALGWLNSPVAKIMKKRGEEFRNEKVPLYGSVANYFAFTAALQDLNNEDAARPRNQQQHPIMGRK